eukprot:CAMPEP_0197023266 /NCGR_PEP_ID=MMETSP1384-20130603/4014_1 /TAXON_ID=29189 /ORGANISM="Ammonia sp." /LENGTH=409 /DNA_ID=CAMNT_0042451461 /DNA_START=75 /DNA_END=1304 /DNA_ORIENTATION=+
MSALTLALMLFSTFAPNLAVPTTVGTISDDQTVTGTIRSSQSVWYEVTLTGATEQIVFESCGSTVDTVLALHLPSGARVAVCDNCNQHGSFCGAAGDLTVTNIAAGTYYLRIWAKSGSGTYQVSMHDTAGAGADASAPNLLCDETLRWRDESGIWLRDYDGCTVREADHSGSSSIAYGRSYFDVRQIDSSALSNPAKYPIRFSVTAQISGSSYQSYSEFGIIVMKPGPRYYPGIVFRSNPCTFYRAMFRGTGTPTSTSYTYADGSPISLSCDEPITLTIEVSSLYARSYGFYINDQLVKTVSFGAYSRYPTNSYGIYANFGDVVASNVELTVSGGSAAESPSFSQIDTGNEEYFASPAAMSSSSQWVYYMAALLVFLLTVNILLMCYIKCCKAKEAYKVINFNESDVDL